MNDRDQDRMPEPDPTHDEWSAWLPELDPPASAPTPPLPQASAPAPAPVPPPVPQASSLPHAPAPARWWAATPTPQGGWAPPPTTYLGWAILCTIVCFTPFGVVAIVKASQVSPLWARGDWDGARRASRTAKAWCLLALAVWPGSFLLFACLGLLVGGHFSMHL